MSSGSSFDTKERIKQAIDIVELIGSFMQLRRQGRNFVGLCPWHDDSRPSLQVNPERQSFKCWVCDIGGDIFSFIMKMEGVDFREALQMLAERARHRTRTPRKPITPPPVSSINGLSTKQRPGRNGSTTIASATRPTPIPLGATSTSAASRPKASKNSTSASRRSNAIGF